MAQGPAFEVPDHEGGPAAADQVRCSLSRMVLGAHAVRLRAGADRNVFVPSVVIRTTLPSVLVMDAFRPDELPLVWQHYFNAGDVPGLMAHYYAADPTYAPVPGVVLHGAEVEDSISRLVALGHSMRVTVRHVLHAGDTALLVVDHEIPALGMTGTATDVARLQADGTWRCIIDNPHGGARDVALADEALNVLRG